jgi:hypothetical protein
MITLQDFLSKNRTSDGLLLNEWIYGVRNKFNLPHTRSDINFLRQFDKSHYGEAFYQRLMLLKKYLIERDKARDEVIRKLQKDPRIELEFKELIEKQKHKLSKFPNMLRNVFIDHEKEKFYINKASEIVDEEFENNNIEDFSSFTFKQNKRSKAENPKLKKSGTYNNVKTYLRELLNQLEGKRGSSIGADLGGVIESEDEDAGFRTRGLYFPHKTTVAEKISDWILGSAHGLNTQMPEKHDDSYEINDTLSSKFHMDYVKDKIDYAEDRAKEKNVTSPIITFGTNLSNMLGINPQNPNRNEIIKAIIEKIKKSPEKFGKIQNDEEEVSSNKQENAIYEEAKKQLESKKQSEAKQKLIQNLEKILTLGTDQEKDAAFKEILNKSINLKNLKTGLSHGVLKNAIDKSELWGGKPITADNSISPQRMTYDPDTNLFTSKMTVPSKKGNVKFTPEGETEQEFGSTHPILYPGGYYYPIRKIPMGIQDEYITPNLRGKFRAVDDPEHISHFVNPVDAGIPYHQGTPASRVGVSDYNYHSLETHHVGIDDPKFDKILTALKKIGGEKYCNVHYQTAEFDQETLNAIEKYLGKNAKLNKIIKSINVVPQQTGGKYHCYIAKKLIEKICGSNKDCNLIEDFKKAIYSEDKETMRKVFNRMKMAVSFKGLYSLVFVFLFKNSGLIQNGEINMDILNDTIDKAYDLIYGKDIGAGHKEKAGEGKKKRATLPGERLPTGSPHEKAFNFFVDKFVEDIRKGKSGGFLISVRKLYSLLGQNIVEKEKEIKEIKKKTLDREKQVENKIKESDLKLEELETLTKVYFGLLYLFSYIVKNKKLPNPSETKKIDERAVLDTKNYMGSLDETNIKSLDNAIAIRKNQNDNLKEIVLKDESSYNVNDPYSKQNLQNLQKTSDPLESEKITISNTILHSPNLSSLFSGLRHDIERYIKGPKHSDLLKENTFISVIGALTKILSNIYKGSNPQEIEDRVSEFNQKNSALRGVDQKLAFNKQDFDGLIKAVERESDKSLNINPFFQGKPFVKDDLIKILRKLN